MRLCALLVAVLCCVAPSSAQTPVTSFSFASQPGDWVGQGQTQILLPPASSFTATKNFDGGVSLTVSGANPQDLWLLDFAAPGDVPLAPGTYLLATRFPFQLPTSPGLDVSGEGRGCNRLNGQFTVLDVVYGAGDTIVSFAADFEQRCEGQAAAMFGSVRYNFVPPPFTVSPGTIAAGAAAQIVPLTVAVNPPSGQWSASSAASWISVPATGGGGTVDVTLTRNTSTQPRTGSLTLAGHVITVTQRGNGTPGTPGRPAAAVIGGIGQFAWPPSDATGGDATSYRLEVGTAPGATAAVFTSAGPSFSVPGVPPGTFYLRVSGANEFGVSAVSEELVLTVSATGDSLPDPPRNLTVSLALGRPTFSWSPPLSGGAVNYIFEAGASTGSSNRAVIQMGGATSLAAGYVPPGIYFVRVSAVNSAGRSAPSNEVLLRLGATTAPPGPPALDGGVTGSTVTLTWAASAAGDAALRYRIEAGVASGSTALVRDTADNGTSVSFAGVPPGQYYVRVRGINARGVGPASNEVRIVVP
jgi:Putative binding domain, N-terminal